MLPNFLVIGAAKAGTTTLCHWLAQHPQVSFAPQKEVFFFSHEDVFRQGLDWYARQFPERATGGGKPLAVGEGSTTYSQTPWFGNSAPRIIKHLPGVRLIFIARHPLVQMQSYFVWSRSMWRGTERGGIHMPGTFEAAIREHGYLLDVADYAMQLRAYGDHVAPGNRLVLFFEDLRADPAQMLDRCCTFLGIDPGFRPPDLGRARNTSQELMSDRPLVRLIRRVPGVESLKRLVPHSQRGNARRVFKRPAEDKPEYSPELLAYVRQRLSDPTQQFLLEHGKPAALWRFDRPPG